MEIKVNEPIYKQIALDIAGRIILTGLDIQIL